MKRRARHVLLPLVTALCAVTLTPAAGATEPVGMSFSQKPFRTVWDDFSGGFNPPGEKPRWSFPSAGSWVTDDGVTSTSKRGLSLLSAGTNPRTGQPAFTHTVPQEDPAGAGLPGGLDHVKWLAFTNHQSSAGYQGFDAVPGQELSCETTMSGRTFGTAQHPFGPAVSDPDDDLRLASVGMPVLDLETSMIFDFFVTNKKVYIFYERVPDNRANLGDYAAFTYAVPVASRKAGDRHHFKISYDRSAGVVRWLLNGKQVFKVDRIGELLPTRENLIIDNGGTPTRVAPRQLSCGMGLFSILDAAAPGAADDSALVRLSPKENHYFRPSTGAPDPQSFHDNTSPESSRLFGQGARLDMSRYVVSSVPTNRD